MALNCPCRFLYPDFSRFIPPFCKFFARAFPATWCAIAGRAPSWLCPSPPSGRTQRSRVSALICSDDAFKLLAGTHLFGQLAQSADTFVCGFSSHFLIELLKKKNMGNICCGLRNLSAGRSLTMTMRC
jgi:hypothetical protein